ncbi:MAG: GNAT family N-acetyltransferase [Fusobacteriaceae bacterium]|jgi:ribosomal protein S18 acetylase RimI-like enzyme|nr:GNAT family N-acetyltransferase [Fusobacteriaceae bacterium]
MIIKYKKLDKQEIEDTKNLIKEYINWVDIDLSFQDIEDELKNFPLKYEKPYGAFFIAKNGDEVVGSVGLKKIESNICEMKRLYVKDKYKGYKIGETLVGIIIGEAQKCGYEKMRLDTLKKMGMAQNLYKKYGFYEISAYVYNPIEGALYMERDLKK